MRRQIVFIAALALGAAVLIQGFSHAEDESVTVTVRGAQASRTGGKSVEIAPALAAYADVLRAMEFDKYEDLGGGSGKAKPGGTVSVKVGTYAVEVAVAKKDARATTLNVVVKEDGREVAQMPMKLKPGEVSAIRVGKRSGPVILLVKLG